MGPSPQPVHKAGVAGGTLRHRPLRGGDDVMGAEPLGL